MEPDDPFTEGIPDFGNEALNLLAQNLARGVQTAKAIASIDDMAALMKAVASLDDAELRQTLFAMTLRYRQAVDPDFKPEFKPE